MSEKQHYCYELIFTLKTPFLSKKVGAQQFGYDMSMLKDAEDYPVFLGSQIRGNLRHALQHFQNLLEEQGKQPEKLKEIKLVLALFGDSSDKNDKENFAPNRASLNFAYYWQLSEEDKKISANNEPRYRIGINKATGTVKTGNLQVIENIFKSGLSVDFSGQITTQLTKDDAKIAEYWLRKAAQFIPAIGALKGTGFGKVETATLTYRQLVEPETNNTIPKNAERFGIILKLDRPFCIAQAHLPNSNRFVSREFIAGNILLGTIANHYLAESEKKNKDSWFNKIRITHALPAPENYPCRPAVLPLSLAFFEKELKDLALINPREKVFLYKQNGKLLAPEFKPDWKDEDKVKQLVYARTANPLKDWQSSFQRQLVVHTAIEEGTVQAKESALFSLECIDPKQDIWCADVDLSGIKNEAERKEAINLFTNVINGGLKGIGKTKARATVNLHAQAFNQASEITALDGKYVITLQTDARLFAPHSIQATNGDKGLYDLYANYWKEASQSLLTLSHYYAQQTRVGGKFHWLYYQKHQPYEPQWVTKAGSVFVLRKKGNADVDELLKDWLLHGLPQAKDAENSTWENNPLIRENGFGEVLINAAIHEKLKVTEDEGVWL